MAREPRVARIFRRMERRLAEAELRLATLADALPALVSFVDLERRYQYVNAAYERWFGTSRDAFVGVSMIEALGEDAYRTLEPHLDLAFAGAVVQFREKIAYRTGARDVDVSYVPMRSAAGDVTGVAVLVRDISVEARLAELERQRYVEQVSANERLDRLLGIAARLAVATDAQAIARAVVESACDALAAPMGAMWRRDGERLELVHARGIGPELLAAYGTLDLSDRNPVSEACRTMTPVWLRTRADVALRFPELEAHYRPAGEMALSTGAVPIVVLGEVVAVYAISFHDEPRFDSDDRTLLEIIASHACEALRRDRMYQQAEHARRDAEAANRAKDQFLAMLSHELRNPLAPLTSALELMKFKRLGEGRERDIIERQVRHLTRLVDDLLDVSRITGGKLDLTRTTVRVASFVERAIELTGELIERHNHTLTLQLDGDLAVDGDETRLTQITSNLLSNAARYTPEGGHIVLSTRREGSDAVLRVRDNGVGIDQELLPRVFDMFVQAPQAIARTTGGLGLGLTIVKSLVELHGGTITARSAGPGSGTEVEVRLAAVANVTTPATVTEISIGSRARTGRRVLIVDDNRDAAMLLAELLDDHGHVVRTAFDGSEALAAADEHAPEVAILDLGLPLMDGYEVARRLRASHGALRLIALSGYSLTSDHARSREAGFDQHLAKPVNIAALLRLVDD